jgi:hypothetical protein
MTLLSQLTRAHPQSEDGEMRHRAAAEIERLTAEVERLTARLELSERVDKLFDETMARRVFENERLRAALDGLSNVTALGNLLAVIHRDGGHHTEAVGVEQSVADAHKVWADLISALEDITEAAEEAWGPDRPCVKFARAALKEPRT